MYIDLDEIFESLELIVTDTMHRIFDRVVPAVRGYTIELNTR